MTTEVKANKTKIYYDQGKFKGNTFEQNINTVNKLYLGLGLKVSTVPYIYKNESDHNIYLSANSFKVTTKEGEQKVFNYPTSFLYNVFYYNYLLFYLDTQNNLQVFKLDRDNSCINKKSFQQTMNINKTDNKITQVEIDKNEVSKIFAKLEKINENNDLNEVYQLLCDILEKDLKEPMKSDHPKDINGTLTFEINDPKFDHQVYTCTLRQIKYQIDGAGILREKLILQKGKVSFKDGIDCIKVCSKLKETFSINNTFKSPILFKNFEEEEIPQNNVVICKFKSGFDIDSVKKQLIARIEAIRNFCFKKGETPLYFIGIVNFDFENVDKLGEKMNFSFDMEENVLIIATIDSKYFGIDLSCEVDHGYLLFKKLDNLENKMENMFKDLSTKMDNYFSNLFEDMSNLHPNYKFNKNIIKEKKKISQEERKEE